MPVDAAVGRADLLANMHYGEGSDTWSASPLGCAAVLATLDEFETTDVLAHARELSKVIEAGLCRLSDVGRGGQRARRGGRVGRRMRGRRRSIRPTRWPTRASRPATWAMRAGRAIHLLGPLAGKVIRVSPPLVMPLDEARDYLDAMFQIFSSVQQRLESG